MPGLDPVAFAKGLGIPGLFDVHTHFLPPRVMAKVRRQFDTAGPLIGSTWPLEYRGPDEELVATLRGFGVRRFSALSYAHRPGMAEFLNDWSFGFADRTPGCLRSATFYPEPDAASYVVQRLEAGAEIFKVHVRWAASMSATRCSARSGECSRTPASRSSCTRGPDRWARRTRGPGRWPTCSRPTRGSRW